MNYCESQFKSVTIVFVKEVCGHVHQSIINQLNFRILVARAASKTSNRWALDQRRVGVGLGDFDCCDASRWDQHGRAKKAYSPLPAVTASAGNIAVPGCAGAQVTSANPTAPVFGAEPERHTATHAGAGLPVAAAKLNFT